MISGDLVNPLLLCIPQFSIVYFLLLRGSGKTLTGPIHMIDTI